MMILYLHGNSCI